jgi:hypothetical protein
LADGFQSVPVDWTISSVRKRAFFAALEEIFVKTKAGSRHESSKPK